MKDNSKANKRTYDTYIRDTFRIVIPGIKTCLSLSFYNKIVLPGKKNSCTYFTFSRELVDARRHLLTNI